MDLFGEMGDIGTIMAMDVDDVDHLELFGESMISTDNELADADLLDNFEDENDTQMTRRSSCNSSPQQPCSPCM